MLAPSQVSHTLTLTDQSWTVFHPCSGTASSHSSCPMPENADSLASRDILWCIASVLTVHRSAVDAKTCNETNDASLLYCTRELLSSCRNSLVILYVPAWRMCVTPAPISAAQLEYVCQKRNTYSIPAMKVMVIQAVVWRRARRYLDFVAPYFDR